MGYDTTGSNDKVIIGVAVASALTLAGLIPLFHAYFDSTIGARQAEAIEQGSYPRWVVEEDGTTRALSADEASAYQGAGRVRRATVAEVNRLESEQRLQEGRLPIEQAMSQVANGQRGGLRAAQNETLDAVQGWNAMENTEGLAAARRAVAERAARRAAAEAAAAEAAAAAAAAAEAAALEALPPGRRPRPAPAPN
ncbi:MAG: hypothetical protein H6725_04690 [Sandaracinaceae bacterium]|nr:hypothetical protein [Sandaracinaceae bacterium]